MVRYRGDGGDGFVHESERLGTARWADGVDIAKRYAYRPGDFWLGRLAGDEAARIGLHKKGHVFLVGATRTGKGRSFIVNNLATWEGNVIAIDPKGENASLTAMRRGPGDQYCKGMQQDVYVLDPFGQADGVPDELKAYYDPLEDFGEVDPNDPRVMRFARLLAQAFVAPNENAPDSNTWVKKGRQYIAAVIAFLITDKEFEGRRNLVTLGKLVFEGMPEEIESHYEWQMDNYRELTDDDKKITPPPRRLDGRGVLHVFMGSSKNERIKRIGNSYANLEKNNDLFSSITSNAEEQMFFLTDDLMETVLVRGKYTRTFSAKDIKRKRMSVYLCLRPEDSEDYGQWQKMMTYILMESITADKTLPVGGQILLCLDEFLNLGVMDRMKMYSQTFAEYGKIFYAVQDFGDLEKQYGQGWKTFLTNSVCLIWMGVRENTVRKYLSDRLGEVEILRTTNSLAANENVAVSSSVANSLGFSETTAEAVSDGTTWGTSSGESRSEGSSSSDSETWSRSEGENFSRGTSDNYNKSWNENRGHSQGRSEGRNWGKQKGRSWGATYNPTLFGSMLSNNQKGYNSSQNQGGSYGWNTSESWGSGEGESRGSSVTETSGRNLSQSMGGSRSLSRNKSVSNNFSRNEGGSETISTTDSKGRNVTVNFTNGKTETTGTTKTQTEGLHKRFLMTVDEINRFLEPFEDREDVRYPGFALIDIAGEDPFVVRKCFYDEDPEFIGCFSKHPMYDFLGHDDRPMLGWEYTSAHFLNISMPEVMARHGYQAGIKEGIGDGVDLRRMPDLEVIALHTPDADEKSLPIPEAGRLIDCSKASEPLQLVLRTDKVVDVDGFERSLWGPYIDHAEQLEREAEAARIAAEEEERRRRQKFLEAEAAREARERAALEEAKRREEEEERRRQAEAERLRAEAQAAELRRKEALAREIAAKKAREDFLQDRSARKYAAAIQVAASVPVLLIAAACVRVLLLKPGEGFKVETVQKSNWDGIFHEDCIPGTITNVRPGRIDGLIYNCDVYSGLDGIAHVFIPLAILAGVLAGATYLILYIVANIHKKITIGDRGMPDFDGIELFKERMIAEAFFRLIAVIPGLIFYQLLVIAQLASVPIYSG